MAKAAVIFHAATVDLSICILMSSVSLCILVSDDESGRSMRNATKPRTPLCRTKGHLDTDKLSDYECHRGQWL
jgi:hypothetical protein